MTTVSDLPERDQPTHDVEELRAVERECTHDTHT